MSEALNVELPPDVMAFAAMQAADRGLGGAGDYIRELVIAAQQEHDREQLSAEIRAGLASPIVDIRGEDWTRLREQSRNRGLRQQK
jgi:hypothetical protein